MAWTNPETFTAGQTLTAASMNAISGNLSALGDAWIAYTPSLTNITLGNGTLQFEYMNTGKLYAVRFAYEHGSTSSITGNPEFSTPNGSTIDANSTSHAIGTGTARDSGASVYPGTVVPGSSLYTNFRVLVYNATLTYATLTGLSSSVPFTWATGDKLHGTLVYESTT